MSETAALVETDEAPRQALAHAGGHAITPMEMLNNAVQEGADLEKLQQLMDLQERWEANEARKQYKAAVADFKRNPPVVVKDMLNKQYNSRYSSLANLVNTVNEAMSPFGLTAHWDFEQTDKITVTCVLSHVAGHGESVSLSAPPDTSGSKNPIQQIKSTITYLKGATFEAVTGIASREGNMDDDGNGAGTACECITDQQAADLWTLIKDTKTDVTKFYQAYGIRRVEDLPKSKFNDALAKLNAKAKRPANK